MKQTKGKTLRLAGLVILGLFALACTKKRVESSKQEWVDVSILPSPVRKHIKLIRSLVDSLPSRCGELLKEERFNKYDAQQHAHSLYIIPLPPNPAPSIAKGTALEDDPAVIQVYASCTWFKDDVPKFAPKFVKAPRMFPHIKSYFAPLRDLSKLDGELIYLKGGWHEAVPGSVKIIGKLSDKNAEEIARPADPNCKHDVIMVTEQRPTKNGAYVELEVYLRGTGSSDKN